MVFHWSISPSLYLISIVPHLFDKLQDDLLLCIIQNLLSRAKWMCFSVLGVVNFMLAKHTSLVWTKVRTPLDLWAAEHHACHLSLCFFIFFFQLHSTGSQLSQNSYKGLRNSSCQHCLASFLISLLWEIIKGEKTNLYSFHSLCCESSIWRLNTNCFLV